MSAKRKHTDSPPPPPKDEEDSNIAESEPIDDRSSRFIGYYSPSLQPKALQNFVSIGGASHKILGWRRESNQQSLTKTKQYVSGHDDDGEQYGGRKVENVLKTMNVTGTCVVARWWGGVLLGPVRFEHIENAAKDAVGKWLDHEHEKQAKKRRIEEEAIEKPKVIEVLKERDQSIVVLRQLGAEKEYEAKHGRKAGTSVDNDNNDDDGTKKTSEVANSPVSSTAAKEKASIDYDSMPLEQLRALEKVRDKTLSFLLKRIDKAEAQIAAAAAAAAVKEKPP